LSLSPSLPKQTRTSYQYKMSDDERPTDAPPASAFSFRSSVESSEDGDYSFSDDGSASTSTGDQHDDVSIAAEVEEVALDAGEYVAEETNPDPATYVNTTAVEKMKDEEANKGDNAMEVDCTHLAAKNEEETAAREGKTRPSRFQEENDVDAIVSKYFFDDDEVEMAKAIAEQHMNQDTTTTSWRSTRMQTVMITAGESLKDMLYKANDARRTAMQRTHHPYESHVPPGYKHNIDVDDDDAMTEITEVAGNLTPERVREYQLNEALKDDYDLEFDDHEVAHHRDDDHHHKDEGVTNHTLMTQGSGESSDEFNAVPATVSDECALEEGKAKTLPTPKSKIVHLLGRLDWLHKTKKSRKARKGTPRSSFDRKSKVMQDLSKYGYSSAKSFDSFASAEDDSVVSTYKRKSRCSRATTLAAVVTATMLIVIGAIASHTKGDGIQRDNLPPSPSQPALNEIQEETANEDISNPPLPQQDNDQIADDDKPRFVPDFTYDINDAFAPIGMRPNAKPIALMDILEAFTPSQILEDPTTPQYRARAVLDVDTIDTSTAVTEDDVSDLVTRVAERYALATLYYALGGEAWKNSVNWATDIHTDICQWYGITCTTGGSMRVQHISLADNGLSGTLPPEIGILESVETLDLQKNWIAGDIPKSVGGLKKLRQVRLGFNKLTNTSQGVLEPFYPIGDIVQELELNDNLFEGPLPDNQFAYFSSVRVLSLANNQLRGSIPSGIREMKSSLKLLDLSGNQFSSALPPDIGDLKGLLLLDLSDNSLEGELPETLMFLEDLQTLRLSSNQLSGPVPSFLHELVGLDQLDLSHNDFSGPVPANLGLLASLETLRLEGNARLNEAMPDQLCSLAAHKLETLSVDCTAVECTCCTCINP
jgi:hypothetical protein